MNDASRVLNWVMRAQGGAAATQANKHENKWLVDGTTQQMLWRKDNTLRGLMWNQKKGGFITNVRNLMWDLGWEQDKECEFNWNPTRLKKAVT